MHPRIREIIDNSKYCQISVSEVGKFLPEDDAELDQWIETTITNHDQGAFVYLVFSALNLERKVSSRHLSKGLALLPEYTTMACVAWKVQGDDVPEQLFSGFRMGGITPVMRIAVLFVIAVWCQERREGALPPDLINEACLFARDKKLDKLPLGLLVSLATRLNDTRLFALICQSYPAFKTADVVQSLGLGMSEGFLTYCQCPMFDRIIETPKLELSGFTVRRSVAHIGRNEICPCGSEKKYKRCCFDKDRERLRLSTSIPGKTYAEVWADPEQYLTAARLEATLPHDLPRLDPLKIPPPLLPAYITKLLSFGLLDTATLAFEKLGCPEALSEAWHGVMWAAMNEGNKGIADRLLAACGGTVPPSEPLHPGAQLLLVRDDPPATLALLEEFASKAIKIKNSEELEELAFGILCSPLRALGILVARSLIPIMGKKHAVFVLDRILDARLKLGLSLDDPYADILDKRFAEEAVKGGGKETEALRTARQNLQAKANEVQQMKQKLELLRAEIESHEKAPPAPVVQAQPQAPIVPAAPVDKTILRELREKVSALKADLKQRHTERATLRRELDKTVTDLETLRAKQKQAEPPDAHARATDNEDHLVLPGDVDGNQPLRLLEFPKKFQDTLSSFPRPVARAAMTLLGRLAAGEPAAFVGVVRLKDTPNTLRVRIGHRLLFHLEPDTVQIVDLINRKDLERRIKTL